MYAGNLHCKFNEKYKKLLLKYTNSAPKEAHISPVELHEGFVPVTNPLHPHSVVLCDLETAGNTKTYLK